MNEIEKLFFKTFEIKAYYKYLLIDKTTKWRREKLLDKANFIDFVRSGKDYLLLKVVKYNPPITDSILLKLICVYIGYERIYMGTFEIDHFRRFILSMLMDLYKETININKKERLKHQVQALFKEKQ